MAEISGVFADLNTRLRKFKNEWAMEFTERVQARTPVLSGEMQRSWGITQTATDLEIYNTAEHASFVEWGTVHMAPRAPLRTTLQEKDEIAEIAAQRSKK